VVANSGPIMCAYQFTFLFFVRKSTKIMKIQESIRNDAKGVKDHPQDVASSDYEVDVRSGAERRKAVKGGAEFGTSLEMRGIEGSKLNTSQSFGFLQTYDFDSQAVQRCPTA
jgi:hypothetical protein